MISEQSEFSTIQIDLLVKLRSTEYQSNASFSKFAVSIREAKQIGLSAPFGSIHEK